MGATTLGLAGLLLGNSREGGTGALAGLGAGAYAGAKMGSTLGTETKAAQCTQRQRQLDEVSMKL
ncbi:hypothetical protein [Variovorax rhizosphaerae]|uniref:Glycine zipper domain-containing protein n=1 Tax=Variovorax rhizosphaerae TaxID=1836200 RepID=A0ABU8WQX0_9BURK